MSGSSVGSLLGDRKNALDAFRTKSAASFFFLLKKRSAQLFPFKKNARCEHALMRFLQIGPKTHSEVVFLWPLKSDFKVSQRVTHNHMKSRVREDNTDNTDNTDNGPWTHAGGRQHSLLIVFY